MRKKAKYLADVPDAVALSSESLQYDPRYTKKMKITKVKKQAKEAGLTANADEHLHTHVYHDHHHRLSHESMDEEAPKVKQDEAFLQSSALSETSPYSFFTKTNNLHLNNTHDPQNIEAHLAESQSNPSKPNPPSENGSTHAVAASEGAFYENSDGRPLSDTLRFQPSRHNFQSAAVDMEYSIISSILGSAKGQSLDMTSSVSPSLASTSGDSPLPKMDLLTTATNNNNYRRLHPNKLNQFPLSTDGSDQTHLSQVLEVLEQLNQQQQQQKQQQNQKEWYSSDGPSTPKRPLSLIISNATSDSSILDNVSSSTRHNSSVSSSVGSSVYYGREPADIYANVRQPFSYTPAYHQLTIYIRTRFNREQQLRIARSMASYRPSFIACTNTLTEDDLIFMEQCFQRTLLEYEKFISYSGTPTVVWRRTGQVAAVGKEFCMLTGWSRERLLSEHTFIVELMDDSSALEYFEMFSKMAFGDSRGANMTECTLLSPQGQHIKTTSIWTLKRDVFGIPMMIVGNFLPILPN